MPDQIKRLRRLAPDKNGREFVDAIEAAWNFRETISEWREMGRFPLLEHSMGLHKGNKLLLENIPYADRQAFLKPLKAVYDTTPWSWFTSELRLLFSLKPGRLSLEYIFLRYMLHAKTKARLDQIVIGAQSINLKRLLRSVKGFGAEPLKRKRMEGIVLYGNLLRQNLYGKPNPWSRYFVMMDFLEKPPHSHNFLKTLAHLRNSKGDEWFPYRTIREQTGNRIQSQYNSRTYGRWQIFFERRRRGRNVSYRMKEEAFLTTWKPILPYLLTKDLARPLFYREWHRIFHYVHEQP